MDDRHSASVCFSLTSTLNDRPVNVLDSDVQTCRTFTLIHLY